jgi:hypothetical protein
MQIIPMERQDSSSACYYLQNNKARVDLLRMTDTLVSILIMNNHEGIALLHIFWDFNV